VPTDLKAGWCSSCRADEHDLCTRARFGGRCACVKCKSKPAPEREPARPQNAKPAAPANGDRPLASVPTPERPSVVRWEDPPPKYGKPIIDRDVEAEMRRNPGRWARVREYTYKTGANTAVTRIRRGDDRFAKGEWEAVARGKGAGAGSVLYVRFVGKGE